MKNVDNYPILAVETQQDWEMWLEKHHSEAKGVWLKLAKKATGIPSITRAEALDGALCYGWIDGQAASFDTQYWLQKFTPRGPRSTWSQVNRDKVGVLQTAGRMRAAGIRQIELAQADGRWEAAYERQSTANVPEDLQSELNKNQKAQMFFNTLNRTNRYAILLRIQTAKKAETRAARIQKFVGMLANNEKVYP
ncbi:MAG TPA: YdeI/OmpD-associated family protein [Ktedonobacteraceae bacterium]